MDPVKKIEDIANRAALKLSKEKERAIVVQLPIWAEPARGFPNTFARSALFTVGRQKQRQAFKKHLVASMKGNEIRYTGEELRQDDETIFMQLLHCARMVPLGRPIYFTSYSFLKEIGWQTSGQHYYDRLAECIDRLKATSLEAINKSKPETERFSGSLIRKFKNKDEHGKNLKQWIVWLEPEIIELFKGYTFSRIIWDQRKRLSQPLAQWLHSFYFTHKEPFPMKVATLHELCGSSTAKLSVFRSTLEKALAKLYKIGFISKYWIDPDNDLVYVEREIKQ